MICQRCAKEQPSGIHTCSPSDLVRAMEAEREMLLETRSASEQTADLNGGALEETQRRLAEVLQQRSELLTALEGVLPFLTGNYWAGTVSDAAVDFAVATARKVAANVKDKT